MKQKRWKTNFVGCTFLAQKKIDLDTSLVATTADHTPEARAVFFMGGERGEGGRSGQEGREPSSENITSRPVIC